MREKDPQFSLAEIQLLWILFFSGWKLGKGQKCIYPFLKQNILVTKKLVTATKPIKRFLYFFIAKGLAEMSPFLTSPFKAD